MTETEACSFIGWSWSGEAFLLQWTDTWRKWWLKPKYTEGYTESKRTIAVSLKQGDIFKEWQKGSVTVWDWAHRVMEEDRGEIQRQIT